MYQWPGIVRQLIHQIPTDEILTLENQMKAFEANEGRFVKAALRQAIEVERATLSGNVGTAGEQARIESIQCNARLGVLEGFLRDGWGLLDLVKVEIQSRSSQGKKQG